jgi:hypothetical protein
VAEWLKAAVSKTVMGHWPIESSNLSLSARFELEISRNGPRYRDPFLGFPTT